MISNEEETRGHKELQKLQLMLRNLEEHNDLPSPEKNAVNPPASMDRSVPITDDDDGPVTKVDRGEFHKFMPKESNGGSIEANEDCNKSLLECDSDILNIEEDISLDDENNWLLDSPVKSPKKPQLWLSQDIKTPGLARVKGMLASKLDLISIENRKEKLSQLLWKHNQGIQPESAPGRLYQAESMCSVMSLDWEYDEDSRQINYGNSQMTSAYTDPAKPRRHKDDVINDFDDLQPMSLDFESPPVVRRSVQVAPGPVITRRGAPTGKKPSLDQAEKGNELIVKPTGGVRMRGSRLEYEKSDGFEFGVSPSYRRSSLSDRSDSSGDLQISPRGSVSSSRSSLASVDDSGKKTQRNSAKGKTAKNNNRLPVKSRTPSNTNNSDEASLVVKLPTSSKDGPTIRRRGANVRSSSDDNIPKRRGAEDASPVTKNDPSLSKATVPVIRRSMPTPRGRESVNAKYVQSPDILPRRGLSPEGRSRSPDIIPRRSLGVVPRGRATSKNNGISNY